MSIAKHFVRNFPFHCNTQRSHRLHDDSSILPLDFYFTSFPCRGCLREQVPGLELIGAGTAPHILPVTLPGYKSEVVLRFLSDRGIYVSSGSACHKGKPSHVYAALKLPKPQLDGILRISFSYDTAREDVDALVQGLKEAQAQLFTSLS